MKIKLSVANYGETQNHYLYRVVECFNNFKKYKVDVTVYSTSILSIPHVKIEPNIGKALPFVCRKSMIDSLNDYDIFIYNENDMLITEDNIDAFLEHSDKLQDGEVSGFIRYETDADGNKILVDPNPYWGNITANKTENSFEIRNKHQGCWVLKQRDFKRAIDSGGFVLNSHDNPYGPLEQGASDPYTQCNLNKVFPLDYNLCERLLIHHMPNKYVNFPEWENYGVTLQKLFQFHL